jgi:Cu(I)/Ag(I) efflux system membrane fusion protein
MDLVKKQSKPDTAVEHAKKHLDTRYVCPMHPRIIKDKQGETCPICGMALVEKKIDPSEGGYPTVKLTPDVVQKMGVRTSKVELGRLWKFIKTVGYVSYNERRLKHISVGTAGWVENLSVRRVGLPVKKGQLLLELYSPEFLEVQKKFIEGQQKDKSGILKKYGERKESVGPRDHLRYMHVPESMMNEIARKQKPKHRLPIYSPMHGTIVRHNIHKHMYVYNDFPMFTIADLSTVWVEANVYEHQLEWVRRGLTAEIEVKALPGKRFDAQITYIYPELDAKTRTLRIRLLVPNPDQLLKPNMFAEVRIFGGPKQNILTLPREALIVTGERESVVLDLGEGKYQPVDVVTGMRSQGQVEILSGVQEGDSVVVSGQFLIDSEANLQASFSRMGSAE